MNTNKIFIQIASYRDPQLIPTIKDCITNAQHPENLVFAICWQHSTEDVWDNLDEYKNDSRFKIIDIPANESKGACWARNKIQQLYDNEEYTLQLDSHHRFVKNWDNICINMIKNLQEKGHKKPLLTSYISSFNPENDPAERVQVPWKMNFDKFTEYKAVLCLPSSFSEAETKLNEPIKAKFYSAHFCFTLGLFAIEVQHDPNLYFTGEETNISIRAYTFGYSMFHPNCLIAWHEYTRKDRIKHWDDNKEWWKLNKISKEHFSDLLTKFINGEGISILNGGKEPYGLGTSKSFKEYELYSELNYDLKKSQKMIDNTLCIQEKYVYNIKLITPVKENESDVDIRDNYKFVAIIFKNKEDNSQYRIDLTGDDIYKSDINISFDSYEKPYKWLYYPYDKNDGWIYDKIETVL
jgi:hypothetical protein